MKKTLRLVSLILCLVMLLGCVTIQADNNFDEIKAYYLMELIKQDNANSKYTVDDILINAYYGNHNGYDIVIMGVADQLVSPVVGTITIADITFTFGYESDIATFYAYKDGSFTPVSDAYTAGLLDETDIYNIAVAKGDIVLPKYKELWTGGNITLTLEETTGTLYVGGEGKTEDYEFPEITGLAPMNVSPIFGNSDIKHVVIEDGITYIGEYFFDECVNIETVEFSKNLEEIGDNCFSNCKNIKMLVFPEGIKRIGNFCFEYDNLNTLTFCGNLPKMKEYSLFRYFEGTVYYPKDNATWTKDLMAKYNPDITWETWDAPKIEKVYNKFDDVKKIAWYTDSVQYVYDSNMMVGTSANMFSPNTAMTRAQVVQVLFNLSGENKEDYMGESVFDDVSANAWYAPAINWAKTNGITSGVDENNFAPNKLVTRLELVVFLNRFGFEMGCYEREHADIKGYADENKVGSWGYTAMQWAVHEKIISGMTETILAPNANANRAQAARMLMKYNEYLKTNVTVLDDAYVALVDHIVKNGTLDTNTPVGYSYMIEEDGKWYMFDYKIYGRLTLTYCTEPQKEELDYRLDFRESISVTMNGLAEEYDYDYYYTPRGDRTHIISSGVYTPDGFREDYFSINTISEEDARAKTEVAMAELVSFIERTLTELDFTMDDLFIEK